MTDFFLAVDRPENRLTWSFKTTDAGDAETVQTVSIPKREWMPQETFDKTEKFVEDNPEASIQDLLMLIISLFDAEGHKWLKANMKKIPQVAFSTMWREYTAQSLDAGESEASSTS